MPTISGPAAPRLHAGVDPRLLRAHRRREEGERHRRRPARALRARGSESPRAARDGGAAAAQARADQLSRRPDRAAWTSSTTPRIRRRARARCRSRASSTSSATTSWRTRRRSSSASRPAARCGCATPTSSPAPNVVKDDAGEIVELRVHLRSGDARRRRARRPQGQGDAALGVGRARGRRRGAALRSAVQRRGSRQPRRRRRGKDFTDVPQSRPRSRCSAAARSSRASASAAPGARYQFERLGYFAVDPDSTPGAPGVQPHGVAQGHLGEDRCREDTACTNVESLRVRSSRLFISPERSGADDVRGAPRSRASDDRASPAGPGGWRRSRSDRSCGRDSRRTRTSSGVRSITRAICRLNVRHSVDEIVPRRVLIARRPRPSRPARTREHQVVLELRRARSAGGCSTPSPRDGR